MIFYKYCDIETAINILKIGKIKLNIPSYFNDPYDSLSYNYKFQADKNDFYALYNSIPIEIREKFPLNTNQLEEAYNQLSFFYMKDLFAITCFSEVYDQILMWSHYASSHNGVCLCFAFNNEISKKIKKCKYVSSKEDISKFRINDALISKSLNWKYEKEWRFIHKIEFPFYFEQLRFIESQIKKYYRDRDGIDISDWITYRKNKIKEVDELNNLFIENVVPDSIYLGCEYLNKLRMRENILLHEGIPVYKPNGEIFKGVAPVKEYKHAIFLKLAKHLHVKCHMMKMEERRYKLSLLKNLNLDDVISQIESIKFATYENIDLFDF